MIQPGLKATRERTRAHNTRLVLKTTYEQGPISRAGIARVTHLTRPTVSDVVADLIDEGLVAEVGMGPSAGGKPPILLDTVPNARHLIGIDLASKAFCGAVVNLRGEIQHHVTVPLDGRDGDAALALVYDIVGRLVAATTSPLLGIGLGSPGLMDAERGIVRRSVNLDWNDLPLRDLLQARYDLPVYVANDSQVAALGEYTFGGGPDVENLVVIKVEHGIGAGIVLNGRLFHGETFGAGEIGHVGMVPGGDVCRCGNVGCLETVAGDPAIVASARAAAAERPDSLLRQFAPDPDRLTVEIICRAVEAGDEGAAQVVRRAGSYLGIAAANVVSLLSVRRIVVAGSVACFGDLLLDAMREEMVRRSLSALAAQVELGLSRLGKDIVILGASALVLNRELGLFASSEDVL